MTIARWYEAARSARRALQLVRVELAHLVQKRGLEPREREVEPGDARDREVVRLGVALRAPAGRSPRRPDSRARAGARPCRTPRRPRRRASCPRPGSRRGPGRRGAACARRSRAGRGTAGRRARACRKSEATWPCRWLTGASGSRSAQASAFAADSPTSSAPISPGPCVTAIRSTRSSPTPASLERLAQDRRDELEVPPRRDLRDDAAVLRVQLGLGGDDVGEDLAVVRDERRGGLVAGRLEPEDQALAGSRTGSRHMISASSRLSV